MSQLKVLLCVLGNDIHVVANRMLEILCAEHGCHTKNIGALTSPEEILQELDRFEPELVLISTLNGQGYFEAKKLMLQLRTRKPTLSRPAFWIGGNLFVGDYDDKESKRYLELGFDRVFSRPVDFDVFTRALAEFLQRRQAVASSARWVENACQ